MLAHSNFISKVDVNAIKIRLGTLGIEYVIKLNLYIGCPTGVHTERYLPF